MSPVMQQIVEAKAERRRHLMALPYPEKVRLVERMRAAAQSIHTAARRDMVKKGNVPCGLHSQLEPI